MGLYVKKLTKILFRPSNKITNILDELSHELPDTSQYTASCISLNNKKLSCR